jgi:hypothetical protein
MKNFAKKIYMSAIRYICALSSKKISIPQGRTSIERLWTLFLSFILCFFFIVIPTKELTAPAPGKQLGRIRGLLAQKLIPNCKNLAALDHRKEELIHANLLKRKGDIAEGQEVAEVREALDRDFSIYDKGAEFQLVKQLEKEVNYASKDDNSSFKEEELTSLKNGPASTSIFNAIKDFVAQTQDGTGGG